MAVLPSNAIWPNEQAETAEVLGTYHSNVIVRLLDSATRLASDTALTWLLERLPNASRVLISSGYFDSAALDWLEPPLAAVLGRNGDVHLTLGSNRGQTARADLDRLLPLFATGPGRFSLRVVYLPDVLFHPKAYLVRSPTSVAALIGSSNLTVRGLAQNFETSVSLEADTAEPPLDRVEEMLEPARFAALPNAFEVTSAADLDTLVRLGVIDLPRPIAPVGAGGSAGSRQRQAGNRRRLFPSTAQIPGLPPLPARRRGRIVITAPTPRALAAPATSTIVVFVFSRNDLKLTGTREISVPAGVREWASAVTGLPITVGLGKILEATIFARLASAPSAVFQSPSSGRLWATGGSGGTHFDVRMLLGNQVVRDLNNQSTLLFGGSLGGGEIGVFQLPADPSTAPVRLTVYTPSDSDYISLDAMAVRVGRQQKRQAVVPTLAFLPPWPY